MSSIVRENLRIGEVRLALAAHRSDQRAVPVSMWLALGVRGRVHRRVREEEPVRHVIIKVGSTHHGSLRPGMLVVIPVEDVSLSPDKRSVTFTNPISGGFSFGEAVFFVDMPDQRP